MASRRKVVFLSPNVVGRDVSALGMRHTEMARALSEACDVVLLASRIDGPPPGDLTVRLLDEGGRLLQEADVIVAQGDVFRRRPGWDAPDVPTVIDLASPFFLEHLQGRDGATDTFEGVLRTVHHQLDVGDFFICGSQRQRDLVLGMLLASGRLNPRTYRGDPTFQGLVAAIPTGVPDGPLPDGGDGPRCTIDGLDEPDILLYWGGGLWPWMDPGTVLDAIARIAADRQDVKVLFAGGDPPVLKGSVESLSGPIRDRARQMGLLDETVFFHPWVPYDERGAFLRDADIGISAHPDLVEARFAMRSRITDYLWAGLPIITTEGDEGSDLVRAEDLGEVVPPGDVEGWVRAILSLVDDPRRRQECGRRSRSVGESWRWSEVTRPLVDFCRDPRRAPDREPLGRGRWLRSRALIRDGGKALALARAGRFGDIIRGVRWRLLGARYGGRGR
jgi:glycosyltransferase involved in cell wall biosynthesis